MNLALVAALGLSGGLATAALYRSKNPHPSTPLGTSLLAGGAVVAGVGALALLNHYASKPVAVGAIGVGAGLAAFPLIMTSSVAVGG